MPGTTLPPTGREYATWTVTGTPDGTSLEVTFDRVTWHPLTRVAPDQFRALVAGPSATDNPADTIVLPVGRQRSTLRLVDTPEVIVRDGGTIFVG